MTNRLLAAFYGDDFTGSSENLAQYRKHGLRCRLYFDAARPDRIAAAAGDFDVIGFAGTSRSLAPSEIKKEVQPVFALMRRLDPVLFQYKICSTFDSSPTVGSFGQVMACARREWKNCALPVFAATPSFGRYTAFSTHFIASDGDIHRLDRDAGMTNHPATPMRESDLRRHLEAQTDLPAGAVMLPDYGAPDGGRQRLQDQFAQGGCVVLDAVDNEQLLHVSRLLLEVAQSRAMLAIAAQGLADGLGRLWSDQFAQHPPSRVATTFPGSDHLLVLSGSCAPQTHRQLDALETHGGSVIHLSPEAVLADPDLAARQTLERVEALFAKGKGVAVATARSAEEVIHQAGADRLAQAVGSVFARVANEARRNMGLTRIVFAGGDTSSYAMRRLGAEALDITAFDAQWSGHICQLVSADAALHGLEVMLKGGQVGGDDFFLRAKSGTAGGYR